MKNKNFNLLKNFKIIKDISSGEFLYENDSIDSDDESEK